MARRCCEQALAAALLHFTSTPIARHNLDFEYEADGKPGVSKVAVLQIWTKDGGAWKLLACQAVRRPS